MAGQRQPIALLEAKGAKHFTKAEIEERKAREVKPCTTAIHRQQSTVAQNVQHRDSSTLRYRRIHKNTALVEHLPEFLRLNIDKTVIVYILMSRYNWSVAVPKSLLLTAAAAYMQRV